MDSKVCTKCEEIKSLDKFYNKKTSRDGKRSQCKTCDTKDNSRWIKENPEKNRKIKRNQRKKNPDKYREMSRKSSAKARLDDPDRANERSRKWRKLNPKQANCSSYKSRLKREYGLTIQEYEAIREKQRDCCLICNKSEEQIGVRLNVDHNHSTGKVRGLLCPKCNKAIGLLEDNVSYLIKAAEYLSSNV